MDMRIALHSLYETGWKPGDQGSCAATPDGWYYPTPERVHRELLACGVPIEVKPIPELSCVRASWTVDGEERNAVATTTDEVSVHALASIRRTLAGTVE